MASIFCDPSRSVNGSGSFADPRNTWSGLTFAYGNNYYQKEGTSYTGNLALWNATGTPNETNRITVGTYRSSDGSPITDGAFDLRISGWGTTLSSSGSPRARVVGDTTTHMIDIAAKTYITIDGLELTGNPKDSGLFAAIKNGSGVTDGFIIVKHCWVHGIVGSVNNSGIYLFGNNNDVLSNIVHDINEDGIYIAAAAGGWRGRVARNLVWAVSKANETTTGNGDCVQITGDVLGGSVTENLLDHTNADCKQCLNQSTGTGGSRLIIVGNRLLAYADARFNKALYLEHPSFINGNHADGGIYSVSVPLSSKCQGNVVVSRSSDDDAVAIHNAGANTVISGNTVLFMGTTKGANNRGISHFDAAHTGCAIQNNIVSGFKYGIRYHPTAAPTESHNDIYSATDPVVDNAYATRTPGTGDKTVDPQLDGAYRPQNPALLGAGTYVRGRDFYGKDFWVPPTIGAVQLQAARELAGSRMVASRRGVG